MNRNQRLLLIAGGAAAAVLVMVMVGVWLLGGRGTNQDAGMLARLQSGLSAVTSGLTPPPVEVARDFAFRRLDIDVSKAQPEACLVFTRPLDASGKTRYEDYLTLDPVVRIATRVVDARLCLSGLAFDKTYNVTLKTGLPAASGETLVSAETVPVEMRDKPSLVRFSGGIILPRDNLAGVPVTTVNIDRLVVKIIRVGDRLLSQIFAKFDHVLECIANNTPPEHCCPLDSVQMKACPARFECWLKGRG